MARIHQMTDKEHEWYARRSEELLQKFPELRISDVAKRFGMSTERLRTIRRKFGLSWRDRDVRSKGDGSL